MLPHDCLGPFRQYSLISRWMECRFLQVSPAKDDRPLAEGGPSRHPTLPVVAIPPVILAGIVASTEHRPICHPGSASPSSGSADSSRRTSRSVRSASASAYVALSRSCPVGDSLSLLTTSVGWFAGEVRGLHVVGCQFVNQHTPRPHSFVG
jgi:hypothetical protein